jgi:arsenate reductase
MLKVYTYAKCSTCRDATKFLRQHQLAFEEWPIRETPPTLPELKLMLEYQDGQMKKLFNTSGQDYRAQKLSVTLPTLTEAQALALLSTNGNLVKRPFLLGPDFGLVGFDPKVWKKALL